MAACDDAKLQQEQDGDKIQISLSFNIGNSPLSIGGPMAGTKGVGESLFDAIYEGIVSGEIVAAYELTFTNKSTGTSTIFNGRWNDGKTISLEKGEYAITGACTASGNGIYNQCSLTMQDVATVTEQTTSIKIKAQYDCSLLILNDETVDKVVYYANQNDSAYFAQYKTLTYTFLKSSADFTQGGAAFLKVYFKNGNNCIVSLGQINIQKGKYYLLENLYNYADAGLVLDIDKMENGDDNNGDDNTGANPIEFSVRSGSISTRAAISSNSDIANNGGFKVWGFKNPSTSSDWTTVFDGTTVSSSDYGSTWTYSPMKYWDTSAQYKFYAAAPAQNANGTITFADNTICVNNVHYAKKSDTDVECEVQRGVYSAWGSSPRVVEFTLSHIMANLVVEIKISDSFGENTVKLKSLQIEGWNGGNGNFKMNPNRSSNADNAEWTIPVYSNGVLDMVDENGITLSVDKKVIGDYLMIPQSIDESCTIKMLYTIVYTGGVTEDFQYTLKMNQLYQALYTGYRYIATFTIRPEAITFDATCLTDWEDGNNTIEIW